MPTRLFFESSDEKQKTILSVGSTEFANYGYEKSSTNRIVIEAGISKGSLFKYFSTKEDFYFYVLDITVNEFISYLEENVNQLPKELFHRIVEFSRIEFSWYIQNPKKSKIILDAFSKTETSISKKIELRYGEKELNLYYWLLQDVDTSTLREDKMKTLEIIKWFLKGFNDDFLRQAQEGNDVDFEALQKAYTSSLTAYFELLKKGLVK